MNDADLIRGAPVAARLCGGPANERRLGLLRPLEVLRVPVDVQVQTRRTTWTEALFAPTARYRLVGSFEEFPRRHTHVYIYEGMER